MNSWSEESHDDTRGDIMNSPGSYVEPGFFMTFSVMDFAPPPSYEEDDPEVTSRALYSSSPSPVTSQPVPAVTETTETPQRPQRRRDFMDTEYPEWLDDIPPWRNPDPKGEKYLYVWQQHEARIRGHH